MAHFAANPPSAGVRASPVARYGCTRAAVLALCCVAAACGPTERGAGRGSLSLPELDAADYCRIANRIYANEALGDARYLTHWGAGEDFPSFGIGHFIWFPEGVDAPFDETFPSMFAYVDAHAPPRLSPPAWLVERMPSAAPWTDKEAFDAASSGEELSELREWLSVTRTLQARYIVDTFVARWNALELEPGEKARTARVLERLLASPAGLFAAIDYYNFKGLGTNPRERYDGRGWGLLQVLGDVASAAEDGPGDTVGLFGEAAAERLRNRVRLAPPGRDEARWLPGWLRRVGDYASGAAEAGSVFHVTPYVRDVGMDAATLVWFSRCGDAGHVRVQSEADPGAAPRVIESTPRPADALAYHRAEPGHRRYADWQPLPWRHEVRVTGLVAAHRYRYEVEQDGAVLGGGFRTSGDSDSALRFIVYADSETEPESTGERVPWPAADGGDEERRYPVDQTTGYAKNLEVIRERAPDFVAIAGDLVESGGEQRDWDEFWRHNGPLARSTPLYPAPGNHEYFGGPGALGGYAAPGAGRAIDKYRTYFRASGTGADASHGGLYYATRQGPATLIVIDPNDGVPERSATDTNWYLAAEEGKGVAPDWQPGSTQYAWLEQALATARRETPLTFVMFHAAPYSSGIHNRPAGIGDGRNFASGVPLRSLTPLFLSYGVDAVFNGHDEHYEHSVVRGTERRPDGTTVDYDLHFFVVGVGGDGLRGPERDVHNPVRVFLAHDDAPEMYDGNGVLTDGGKHYGHLEVTVSREPDGGWRTRFEPVYVFPVATDGGYSFERRVYDDVTEIRVGAPAASVDP